MENYWIKNKKTGECFAGFDIQPLNGLSSMVLLFPQDNGKFETECCCWHPSTDGLGSLSYAVKFTEGNVTNFDVILKDIKDIAKKCNIKLMCCDLYKDHQLIDDLKDDIKIEGLNQGFLTMDEPTSFMMHSIYDETIRISHPVLKRCLPNIHIMEDELERTKISKAKSTGSISPAFALVNAIAAYQRFKP